MARIPLVGPSAALVPLKAAASECMNLYPELIEDPEERTKNLAILRKIPGIHQFIDTTESAIRGVWSGGGRLFVVAGNKLYEISIGTYVGGNPSAGAGAVVRSTTLPGPAAADANPAILFGNGNQLGIVANGQFYWDNGTGPVAARFLLEGTLTAVGATLTWTAGNQFTSDMVGRAINLNGQWLTVVGYTSATQITASATPAGGRSGTVFFALGGYVVWHASGDLFTADMEGQPIVIDGVTYTVATFDGPGAITLTSPGPFGGGGLAYSTIVTNIPYACDGGAIVTAVTGAYLAGAAWVQRPAAVAIAVSAATNANPCVITTASAHNLTSGDVPSFSGGTGNWTPLNNPYTVTVLSSTTFSIPLNSTAFGALTGTVLMHPEDLGRQVNFSDPFDFTRWRGLSFKTKEAAADYIQAIFADRGLLYIGGTENSEVWQLDTNGLPRRIEGTEVREGLSSRWCLSSLAQSLFFLGGSPRGTTIGYRMRGFVPVRVSTHAVEKSWASGSAYPWEAVTYSEINSDGHQFWVVNWPGAPAWVYDVTASEQLGYPVWHQRSRWNAGTAAFTGNPRAWFHTFIPEWGTHGMHIVGGPESGKLYEMSDLYGDDGGSDIRWRRAIPYRYNGGKKMYFGRQDLQATGSTISRDYSDDAGATFVNPTDEMGDGTLHRFWPPGGSSEGRVWRYTGIGQDIVTLIDLQADETPGTV